MSEPQGPDQPANFTQHVLLVIGEVPMKFVTANCLEHDLTRFARMTYQQACRDVYEVADCMNRADGDEPADTETVRRYFHALTGFTYEVIGAVLADTDSWNNEENIFLNGPEALFADLPVGVYREPEYLLLGTIIEPCIEVVRA